jgi:ammonium transporter Rh
MCEQREKSDLFHRKRESLSVLPGVAYIATGTLTIHAFGAYFGLAVSRAYGAPQPWSKKNNETSSVSDVLSLLGTALLWIYWPSFVGATETASSANLHHCVLHTVVSLLGSTMATFIVSHHVGQGQWNAVHIANATLAGGVAMGASARLDVTVGGALLVGLVAGTVATLGFVHASPWLERHFSVFDTCGVHNLHGLPSVVGGVASAILVTLDSHAIYLAHERGTQALYQILALVSTVALALASGWLTGLVMVRIDPTVTAEYHDAVYWTGTDYLQEAALSMYPPDSAVDKSHHSHGSVLPVTESGGAELGC